MAKHRRKKDAPAASQNLIPMDSLEGDTILERFKSLQSKYGGLPSTGNVINFISATNARLIALIGLEKMTPEMETQCIEFCRYMADTYDESSDVWSAMDENWPSLALVYRVALDAEKARLPESTKRRCKALADYIFGKRADRTIAITYSDGRSDVFEFPRTIPRKYLSDARDTILDIVEDLAFNNGSMYMRYSSGIDGKEIVNAFVFRNGEIQKCSVEMIRMAREHARKNIPIQDDEDAAFEENLIFQVADVDLS